MHLYVFAELCPKKSKGRYIDRQLTGTNEILRFTCRCMYVIMHLEWLMYSRAPQKSESKYKSSLRYSVSNDDSDNNFVRGIFRTVTG